MHVYSTIDAKWVRLLRWEDSDFAAVADILTGREMPHLCHRTQLLSRAEWMQQYIASRQ